MDEFTRAWIRNGADERAAAAGCRFSVNRGAFTVWWIERFCSLYEGEWAGQPLRLHGNAQVDAEFPIDLHEPAYPSSKATRDRCLARCRAYLDQVAAGEPVDWQYDATMRLFGWEVDSQRWGRMVRRFRGASIWVPKKNKKALALDTPVPTPNGWSTIGDLALGDRVFTETGKPCHVTGVHPVIIGEDTYCVVFSNGDRVICNAEHLWKTHALQRSVQGAAGKVFAGNKWTGSLGKKWLPVDVRTTSEIIASLKRRDGAANHSLSLPGPLDLPEAELPIHPYVLGAWLGDGDSDGARITCSETDYNHWHREFAACGMELREKQTQGNNACRAGIGKRLSSTRTTLRVMGVLQNKHIPAAYLRASVSQRLAILQGLLDTDGCIDKPGKCITFCNKSTTLVAGVSELLASLGIKHNTRTVVVDGVEYLWVQFHAFRDQMPVFRLARKLDRMRVSSALSMRARSRTVQIVDVFRVGQVPLRCITVDNPTGLFLCGKTMMITHNSPTLASWAWYLLAGDGERGQKVFFGAKDGMQSRDIVGEHANAMREQSEVLSRMTVINKSRMRISYGTTRSFMQPLSSSDARSKKAKEGLNGSLLVDEVHVVDEDFMRRVSRMGISRAEPLQIEVSTAGDDIESYGKKRYDLAKEILAGKRDDQSTLAIIYEAPQDVSDAQLADDPLKYGELANPAWGHTIDPAEFRHDYQQSSHSITDLAVFKMYRLNIWQRSKHPWLNMDEWQACVDTSISVESLKGQACGAGLDLAQTRDFCSFSLVFPVSLDDWFASLDYAPTSENDNDRPAIDTHRVDTPVRVLTWYWLPEGAVKVYRDTDIQKWIAAGWVRIIPGDVVDYGYVEDDIGVLLGMFDVRMLAYDDRFAIRTIQLLQKRYDVREDEVLKFTQGWHTYTGPTAFFERLVIAGKLGHNDNPVTNWQAGHVMVGRRLDKSIMPIRPGTDGDIRAIDGIVATIMGLDAATRMFAGSVYDIRGVLEV